MIIRFTPHQAKNPPLIQWVSLHLKPLLYPVHLVKVLPGLGQIGRILLEHKLFDTLKTYTTVRTQST